MTETRSKADRWLALESPNSGGHWGCRIERMSIRIWGITVALALYRQTLP